MTSHSPQIYLVDGSGYIFRAFHALPPLTRPDGVQVGAVLGFTTMLIKLLREKNPDYLVVVFDAARANFRNDIYPAYKANREETPPELLADILEQGIYICGGGSLLKGIKHK